MALRHLARRYQALDTEIAELEIEIRRLCAKANPALLAAEGVGPDTAAVLLVAAGDNPRRMKSEKSFAALCGASPVPASSGQTVRHRLNRGGNRQANNALWPMRYHPDAHRRPHQRLRHPTTGRRKKEKRDHPLPEAAHRPTDLPPPYQPAPNPELRQATHPTPTRRHHFRQRRPPPRHTADRPITTRARPLPQPPTRYPLPTLAHPTTDSSRRRGPRPRNADPRPQRSDNRLQPGTGRKGQDPCRGHGRPATPPEKVGRAALWTFAVGGKQAEAEQMPAWEYTAGAQAKIDNADAWMNEQDLRWNDDEQEGLAEAVAARYGITNKHAEAMAASFDGHYRSQAAAHVEALAHERNTKAQAAGQIIEKWAGTRRRSGLRQSRRPRGMRAVNELAPSQGGGLTSRHQRRGPPLLGWRESACSGVFYSLPS